jgi:hypothetical protein
MLYSVVHITQQMFRKRINIYSPLQLKKIEDNDSKLKRKYQILLVHSYFYDFADLVSF